jgi:hypothetical protein
MRLGGGRKTKALKSLLSRLLLLLFSKGVEAGIFVSRLYYAGGRSYTYLRHPLSSLYSNVEPRLHTGPRAMCMHATIVDRILRDHEATCTARLK